ncbi:MAM and LDL-receptor class A domain-containing protein 2-like [Dendronephthya gigantea]|uniref:MAM and LDL-receptor class A domain-containing protein 2-like n=1 Tax=Dendronephthya gigantea TaxID=151771 RepID=UPI00106D1C8C|nr:MAM and LDL-receptor class A domain-containing protein 2-like [Dendronephthya gigantea]
MAQLKFLVCLLFLTQALAQDCGQSSFSDSRVVSGQTARPHSWPWQVSFRRTGSTFHFCGGSLISDQWVVTAAHCVQGKSASGLSIRLGEHSFNSNEGHEVDSRVERVIVHPGYSRLNNDIALVKLSRKISFKPQLRPVCLPQQGVSVDENSGQNCYITGWGRTGANRPGATVLQQAKLPVISAAKCRQHMGSSVSQQMVCAGFGGSSTVSGCMGDSGGPFVCRDGSNRWVLHGAVSWGSRTCSAGHNEFTVFARVSEFVDWIKRYVGDVQPPPPSPQTPRPPQTPSPPQPSSANCNFDSGNICSYENGNGQFQWTVYRGSTPSGGTGPSADVTGRGNYLYIETSSPRQFGDKAAILTPTLYGKQCMKFSYHMYGGGIGTLNIYANNQRIFSKMGNKGNQWVDSSMFSEISRIIFMALTVKFEGARGNSYQGDIAIDAISFTPGSCSFQTPPPPTQRPTRPTNPPTRPTNPPSQTVRCNFDQSTLCSFANLPNDQFDWTIKKGSTPSGGTGPSRDVSGRGNYVFIETSSPRRQGDKAYLASPSVSGAQCLKFSYHMYGASIGSLIVYQSMNGRMTEVSKMSGDQGNQWKKAEVELPSANNYKVIFSGVRGSNYQGDIALDEISITSGKCSGSPGTPPPPVTPRPPSGSCGAKGRGLSDFPKIVGGQQAQPGEWPWQVALLRGSFPFCGGSLVSNEYVITAAHCVKATDWSRVKIRLGEHDMRQTEGHEQDISIARNGITVHPRYNSRRTDYDIAVIKLSTPVKYTQRIKPVCINSGVDFTGQRCYISGWGRLSSGGSTPKVLQEAQVPIVTVQECKKSYGSSITDRMLCAGYSRGGIDTCQGDSGGPLVCQHSDGSWHLTGVTSWGRGCASAGYYGVYAHVANLYPWVKQVTGL